MKIDFNAATRHWVCLVNASHRNSFLLSVQTTNDQLSELQVGKRILVFLVFCWEFLEFYPIQLAVCTDLTQPKGVLKAHESHRCSHMASALLSPTLWQHMAHSLCCQQPLQSTALLPKVKPWGGRRGRLPQTLPPRALLLCCTVSTKILRKNWSLQPQIAQFLGQCVGEVGCPPSSRASNLPLLLGKRSKFLTTRFHQVQWVHWCLDTAAAKKKKKTRDANSLISSLLPCSGPGQGCKYRAGAVSWLLPCSAGRMGSRGSRGAGEARDHTGQPWSFYKVNCIIHFIK